MVRNYTVRRHIKRLKIILDRHNLCKFCPASLKFNSEKNADIPWTNLPCKICVTFIGIKFKAFHGCPCHQLGQEETVKRTLKAIEKFRLKSQ